MHWATWGGHTEIVKLLLEHKVGVLFQSPVRVSGSSLASPSPVWSWYDIVLNKLHPLTSFTLSSTPQPAHVSPSPTWLQPALLMM